MISTRSPSFVQNPSESLEYPAVVMRSSTFSRLWLPASYLSKMSCINGRYCLTPYDDIGTTTDGTPPSYARPVISSRLTAWLIAQRTSVFEKCSFWLFRISTKLQPSGAPHTGPSKFHDLKASLKPLAASNVPFSNGGPASSWLLIYS